MKKFWVRFRFPEQETYFRMGCGLTAVDIRDAWQIIEQNKTLSESMTNIESVDEMTFDDIEKNHMLPNAPYHMMRGIWFPHGL